MAEILVTAATLKSKADELNQMNATFKSQVGELESEENNLTSMWEGEAKTAFHNAFTKDKTQMDNFYNAITKYVAALNDIAAKYESAESKNVQTATSRSY